MTAASATRVDLDSALDVETVRTILAESPKAVAYRRLLAVITPERAAFYGVMAVLAKHLQQRGEADPAGAVAKFAAAVYGSTFLGGLVGDRCGYRLSALAGSGLCLAGYCGLAAGLPFWWAAALLALGIGLFKPVVPTMVGKAFSDGSDAQKAGQARFYSWVNVGGFFGPLLAGALFVPGGSAAFWACAATSGVALGVQVWGWRRLAALDVSALGTRLDFQVQPATSRPVVALAGMCLLSVAFWAGYHSFFGPVALWLDSSVVRRVGGLEVPVAWFQSVNPAQIILLGLVWPTLFARRSLASRIGWSLLLSAASFTLLAWLAHRYGHSVPLVGAVLAVVGVSTAEILISPLGLATVSALAPKRRTGLFMAAWYAASAAGGYLSGLLGSSPTWQGFAKMAAVVLVAAAATGVGWRWLGRRHLSD